MDFSEFVSAVRNGEEDKINVLYKRIFKILTRYIQVRTSSDIGDAEDAAQVAIINTIESIKAGKIGDEEKIIPYLMTSARHARIRTIKQDSKYQVDDEMESKMFEHTTGFDQLVDKERMEVLEKCLDELDEDNRSYIDYFFSYPGVDSKTVSDRFKMSVGNVWVKKHRIVKLLRECVFTKI